MKTPISSQKDVGPTPVAGATGLDVEEKVTTEVQKRSELRSLNGCPTQWPQPLG